MKNPLGLSDEDFLNLNGPPETPDATTPPATTATTTTETEPENKEGEGEGEGIDPAVAAADAAAETDSDSDEGAEDKKDPPAAETQTVTDPSKTATATPVEKKDKGKDGTPTDPAAATAAAGKTDEKKTDPVTPDYKTAYEKIMAPLHANGKTIELKSPEEVIALMQMGANYTKKMQAIAPYRKPLQMLENNGLLDEKKLSFLIDLDKKNPEAIKKLIKESGIDPLTIDDQPQTYFEGNHVVSDEEVNFKTAVDDAKSNPHGLEALQSINGWDQASKDVLWKQPEVIEAIRTQHENGIYAQISSEIERRRALGQIPANMPFLTAYTNVGNELHAAGKFVAKAAPSATTTTQTAPGTTAATPVATRVATPRPQAVNGERVSAASSVRSTPRTTGKVVNPLSMSDEEFLKINKLADRL